ncbi:MAG: hypothetical protein RIR85_840 [Pseudomonadota bacterium]|jgi:hypothetical protein
MAAIPLDEVRIDATGTTMTHENKTRPLIKKLRQRTTPYPTEVPPNGGSRLIWKGIAAFEKLRQKYPLIMDI